MRSSAPWLAITWSALKSRSSQDFAAMVGGGGASAGQASGARAPGGKGKRKMDFGNMTGGRDGDAATGETRIIEDFERAGTELRRIWTGGARKGSARAR